MQAAPITQPDPETVYSIVHVQTGLYFEYNNRNVSAYSGSDNQLFKFEPVEKDGVVYYRIVNPASGLYFYTHDSGIWDGPMLLTRRMMKIVPCIALCCRGMML